jgi:hypothetical protein
MGIDFSEGWKDQSAHFKDWIYKSQKKRPKNLQPDVITMWHYRA